MSPCKMINLFQDLVTKVFPKKYELWIETTPPPPPKVSRPSEIFMINWTQLKSKNNLFLRLEVSTVCQDIYFQNRFKHTCSLASLFLRVKL